MGAMAMYIYNARMFMLNRDAFSYIVVCPLPILLYVICLLTKIPHFRLAKDIGEVLRLIISCLSRTETLKSDDLRVAP